MSDTSVFFTPVRPMYPERPDEHVEGWLEQVGATLSGRLIRKRRASRWRLQRFVAAVAAEEPRFTTLGEDGMRQAARELRRELRQHGMRDELLARSFALIRTASHATLGMRHFDVQIQGGWVMLQGMIAEMNTGEGKTLTATLAAATGALAGIPVHVITVNDYLVSRDAELMAPVYEILGISVGTVLESQSEPERRVAYGNDITYVTNKTVVFDYLRDKIALGNRDGDLQLRLEKLYGDSSRSGRLLLRGLNFAIVDEADSVLIDEARTPLIISAPARGGDEALAAQQGIDIATQLDPKADYVLIERERRAIVTEQGRERIQSLCEGLGGVWNGVMRREELITQALCALKIFTRDEHYLVRDGKIQIIDEYTGRVMPDRTWQKGMHQLIEAKEGCEITGEREPLARISYQRFFRRYLLLGGMTGTAREVGDELGDVYDLPVLRIPTHKPPRRVTLREQVYVTEAEKWEAIGRNVREHFEKGQAVLVGTRSVAASERASEVLERMGIRHAVLNAKQDKEEADIVTDAGIPGAVTIATNMAGRGTDIKLSKAVEQCGGLHVILSERHDSARIDRQLEGRCGRQGDPGTFQCILSMEDDILTAYDPGVRQWLKARVQSGGGRGRRIGQIAIRFAQYLAERSHSKIRKQLLKADRQMIKLLSFSGRAE